MYCIFRSSFRPTRFHPKMKRRYKTVCHEDQAMPYHLMELSNFEIESLRQISLKYWSTVSVHLHNILLILLQAITKQQYIYVYIIRNKNWIEIIIDLIYKTWLRVQNFPKSTSISWLPLQQILSTIFYQLLLIVQVLNGICWRTKIFYVFNIC